MSLYILVHPSLVHIVQQSFSKTAHLALTSVAPLVGHCPGKQRVSGLIPGQGTCMGCSQVPGQDVYGGQPINVSPSHRCVSPSLSPSLLLSKNKK